jgi:putative transposase
MPRQPRLDAPGILHHVRVRGLERHRIFRDDADRVGGVARLADLVAQGHFTVYAWALLSNHAHLLVRTGNGPLARAMRSLLTGYAGAFDRRQKRASHLFQNRYKSIVVEEEPYLLELVRYLRLHPLRAGVVAGLRALERYAWSGHRGFLGTVPRAWQATGEILRRFARGPRLARRAYREVLAAAPPEASPRVAGRRFGAERRGLGRGGCAPSRARGLPGR